ncbi:MAG: Uma2 family endonuclease [Cyanobacteria bacterium J06560_2]
MNPVTTPEILRLVDSTPQIDDLVIEDDTPVDNFFSAKLQRMLVEILYSSWVSFGMERPFVADADIGIFSSVNRPPIVPDVFVSLDVEAPQDFREKKNRTYLVWEFGKSPDVVIEIVSNKVGNELGSKLRDYARLGVSYYVVFDPLQQLEEGVLHVFGLTQGAYERLDQPWLERVGLGVTLWEGTFEGVTTTWLRWCDRDGQLLPTGVERATQAEAKAAKLAEQLRALGVDPDPLN